MKKVIIALVVLFCLGINFNLLRAHAAEPVTDWVIRDFQSDITLNKDSSLTIIENITADCGNLPDKHGIFRVLPLEYQKTTNQKVKIPIELISITDFNDKALNYSTSKEIKNGIHTISWKIGDADKTVTGQNYYKITYKVQNVIRFDNSDFDELYWNLSGNFWESPINNFSATLHFPTEINQNNTKISLYSGSFGNKNNTEANHNWLDTNSLKVDRNTTITNGNGVTLSITFPKNIVTPYKFSLWELYGKYLFLLIPLLVLIICYRLWNKYGRDPKINSAIVPEFEIPEKLTPLAMGVLQTNGEMKNSFIPAEIIYLATNKYVSIKQIQEKSMFKEADYEFTLLSNDLNKLTKDDNTLINSLFSTIKKGETITLSSLKNKFYKEIEIIKNDVTQLLVDQKYLLVKGTKIKHVMIGFAVVAFIGASMLFGAIGYDYSLFALISLMVSAVIFVIFAILMPNRTKEGAFLNHRIQGFKMYMETAEKYRAQFNEKENIFEKFLPYAIMFGMTKKWIKEMKKIYGQEFITSYHPIWFYGMNGSNFDFDSFASNIESVSTQMGSTMASNPSSSGSGGGGFSGGGGGGGGGGGW